MIPRDDNDLLREGALPQDLNEDSEDAGEPRTTRLYDALVQGQKLAFAGAPDHPITTGFPDIDTGLRQLGRKQVTMMAADSGVGKSTLSTQIALHNGAEGHGVVYFNLEMSQEMYGLRTLAQYIRMPTQKASSGDLVGDDFRRMLHGMQDLESASKRIVLGNPSLHRTIPAIRSLVAKAKREFEFEGTPLSLVVIDHILQITVSIRGGDKDEAGKVRADFLKELADANDVHVLALVHVTREGAKTGTMPTKNQLASSAWFDRHADNILMFHQKRNSNGTFTKSNAVLSCQKARWGEPFAVELEYQQGFFFPFNLLSPEIK